MNIQQQYHENYSNALPVSVDERNALTRAYLTEAVVHRIGVSRGESAQLIEMVLGEICDALCSGESVKLSGFGTFEVRAKRERVGRNPKTGVGAKIEARNVLSFKASHILRARVNEGRVPRREQVGLAAAS